MNLTPNDKLKLEGALKDMSATFARVAAEKDLQKNIIKLPFTEEEYYGTICIFKMDSDLNIINLSINKFMALFDKVKINKLIEDDYSSDDFNPDVCDNSHKC